MLWGFEKGVTIIINNREKITKKTTKENPNIFMGKEIKLHSYLTALFANHSFLYLIAT